jgi:hypothetical protein
MTTADQLAQLREYWRAAPKEEQQAINVTAAALKTDHPDHREFVQRRIEAHERRFEAKNYEV